MTKKVRQNQILHLLKEHQALSIRELVAMLDTTEMTMRRDIKELKENNLVNHVYGQVTLVQTSFGVGSDYNILLEQTKMDREKELIGKCAASLISSGDLITVDTGSTAERLVKYIDPNINLTVLCYNYNVLAQLTQRPNISIIMAGGYYHPKDQTFESEEGRNLIRRLRSNKLFISASGIHKTLGMTCSNDYEVLCKRAILESSLTKILMADSSKFDKVCTAYFADLKAIDTIITDEGISPEWLEYCQSSGINVLIAK